MAKKLEIQVDLNSKIKSSEKTFNKLTEQGAFNDSPRTAKTFGTLMEELKSLANVSEPTLKQLSRMNSLFNQMADILVNAAKKIGGTSQEFKDLEKQIDEISQSLKDTRKARGDILKQGRINPDTNQYELFDTYQTEQLLSKKIKSKDGREIKSIATFRKKFDAQGQAIAGAFQDPVAAQQLYDQLKEQQTNNARRCKLLYLF